MTISIWKNLNFYILLSQKIECQLLDTVEQLSLFCHLLESSLARINWIRAVDKFCVEQLISCQKCRANDCRAIEFRAVHPHSYITIGILTPRECFIFFGRSMFKATDHFMKRFKKLKLKEKSGLLVTLFS